MCQSKYNIYLGKTDSYCPVPGNKSSPQLVSIILQPMNKHILAALIHLLSKDIIDSKGKRRSDFVIFLSTCISCFRFFYIFAKLDHSMFLLRSSSLSQVFLKTTFRDPTLQDIVSFMPQPIFVSERQKPQMPICLMFFVFPCLAATSDSFHIIYFYAAKVPDVWQLCF